MTSSEHQVVRNETRAALRRPWILSASIAVVIVIIYIWNVATSSSSITDLTPAPVLAELSLVPAEVVEGQVYRLFTASLLYSSFWSLAASVLTLMLVGPAVESRWGVRRYLASMFICSLGAAIPVLLFEPTVSRWATGNGSVLGLIGAALVVANRAGYNRPMIIGVAVVDIFAYTVLTPESTLWAPVGGVLSGAIIAGLLLLAPEGRYRQRMQVFLLSSFFLLEVVIVGVHIALRQSG